MEVEASIIIRTFNEARHLDRLMRGIREQTFTAWEIVLVDSGSTDSTVEIAQRYTPNICHMAKEEFTFGRSLNLGCRHARGRHLVFISGHAYPLTNNWLSNLLQPFVDPSIAMVYGRQRAGPSGLVSEERDFERLFATTSKILIDEPCGHNGNAAICRDLWLEEPFDESLTGLEDLDWSKKIQRRGYRVYYAADAAVCHVHQESPQQFYKRFFREAVAYRKIFPGHRYGLFDCAKGLTYNIAADAFYALRKRKSAFQILQIPSSRVAEYVGRWRGLHYGGKVTKELLLSLYYPDTTKQVVIEGAGRHRIQEVDIPSIGPDEVLIQIAYVGVCATDLEVASGEIEYYRQGRARYPIVPGHEYSGVVVEIGSAVRGFRKGDKVVGECVIGCGNCAVCRKGELYRCDQRKEVGVINMDGAYSRYLRMPAAYVHRLPRRVLLKEAALIEPLAVCLKGLRRIAGNGFRNGVEARSAACIVGAGPLGNLCAQILKSCGSDVTVVDREQRRLQLLYKYGVNTRTEMETLTEFDYLIDATGDAAVIPHLIERSRSSAKILLLGLPYAGTVPVRFSTMPCYDKELHGSIASERQDWRKAIRLIQTGAVNLGDHTATIMPLESYERAWQAVRSYECFKVLLVVNPSLDGF
jgi:2-desacetyl-2-hydroxyethyl bacteriochlorophyllide A dehydrogenase